MMRIIRGMIGTALTFAVGVGALATAAGTVFWLRGSASFVNVLQLGGRLAVAAFLLGLAFAGVLALAARGCGFRNLSLRLVTGIGAGVGLLYFALISINGIGKWSMSTAIANFVLLTVMGSVSAAAMLLIARKAGAAVDAVDAVEAPDQIDAGAQQPVGRNRSPAETHEGSGTESRILRDASSKPPV